MPNVPDSSEPQAQLALRRKIDAICDRFEQAWSQGQRPRMEDYLAELPQHQRPQLFHELLSSELALRRAHEPAATDSDYLTRFPDYRNLVLEAFSTGPTLVMARVAVMSESDRSNLIAAVRQQLRIVDPGAQGQSGAISGNAESLATADPPAIPPEPLAEQLWTELIRRARISSKTANLDSTAHLQAVTVQLLNAFPALRRQMLAKALLGQASAQIARQHSATERTVATTLQAAIELLNRSSSA